MKICFLCKKEIPLKSKANNVKYCDLCKKEAYRYTEYRTKWQEQKRDKIAMTNTKDKVQCLICGKFYKKPLSHAYYKHQVTEKEYKDAFGLDRIKGITAQSTKELLQTAIKQNYDLVVSQNLLKNGQKTRFKKGDKNLGNYKRSKQTIERLKQNAFKKSISS